MGFPKQTLLLISQNFDDGVSNELDVLNQRCSKYNVLSVETSKIEHLGNFSKTCSKYLSTTIYIYNYIKIVKSGKQIWISPNKLDFTLFTPWWKCIIIKWCIQIQIPYEKIPRPKILPRVQRGGARGIATWWTFFWWANTHRVFSQQKMAPKKCVKIGDRGPLHVFFFFFFSNWSNDGKISGIFS